MIRNRLTLVFVLLACVCAAQAIFTVWVTRSAAHHAQRSIVATGMLNQYLDLGANKQRLKVWFAQAALSGDAAPAQRERLIERMRTSLLELKFLVGRERELSGELGEGERPTVDALTKNFAALTAVIDSATTQVTSETDSVKKASQWRALLEVFDRSEGRDMRVVLEEALGRQRLASDAAERDLAIALRRNQIAQIVLAVIALVGIATAIVYFVRRLQQPFTALVTATEALARGQYSFRSAAASRDEFGVIAQQLNEVAARLDSARTASETVQRELDEAVSLRTDALTRSHEALLRIDQRRRQFFAEISHELRTPVTVIRGEAEIALRNKFPTLASQRESLESIAQTCAQLVSRVEDLLQVARTDAERYAFSLLPVVLFDLLTDACKKMAAVAAHRGIVIEARFERLVPSASIRADYDRLQQALMIVLDNAVRYSPAQTRVILAAHADGENVIVTVSDEGIGLTEDEMANAFDRHFRGDAARALRPEGAGLGLAIAREIVHAHHGDIALQPRPAPLARGTEAVIRLPLLISSTPVSVSAAAL